VSCCICSGRHSPSQTLTKSCQELNGSGALRLAGAQHHTDCHAAEKLARFLLDLSADHDEGKGEIRLALTLTHEEIAQMIGASRETVTRLFADFKKKQLL
jgi:CRP-like cAMP-binding protein